MRIAFFGTPAVAVPALEAFVVADDIEVVAVVTNPDRPKGRSGTPVAPPVKLAAEQHGLTVLQPVKPTEIVDDLAAMELDACAIVAYGAILPRRVLETGGAGFVNLHFSLLPRWRGAAPVQHALRAGDDVTGVTCFVLDEGMDTGPVIAMEQTPIGLHETTGSLMERLSAVGAPLLVDAVRDLVAGTDLRPQSEDGVTYAPKIERDDVRIDWTGSARTVHDVVRSANPAPGAFTTFRGKTLKVWRAMPCDGAGDGRPGEVVGASDEGVVVACGDGAVCLAEVQPAGKARMDGTSFANGYQPEPGTVLGE